MSAKHRPNIYQISYLAFSAATKKCPVFNVEVLNLWIIKNILLFIVKKCARIELNEAIQILYLRDKLGTNYSRLFEKAINDFEAQKRRHTMPNQMNKEENQDIQSTNNETPNTSNSSSTISSRLVEGVIVNTTKEISELHPRSATTSVNPRLRPKPQAFSSIKQRTNLTEVDNSFISKKLQVGGNSMLEFSSPQIGEQNDDEDINLPRLQHLSAFQPYSLAQEEKINNSKITEDNARIFEGSNPFAQPCSSSDLNMDDKIFGEHFDAMRRDRVQCQDEENLISGIYILYIYFDIFYEKIF